MNTFNSMLLTVAVVSGTAFGMAAVQPAQATQSIVPQVVKRPPGAGMPACRQGLIDCLENLDHSVPYCELQYGICIALG